MKYVCCALLLFVQINLAHAAFGGRICANFYISTFLKPDGTLWQLGDSGFGGAVSLGTVTATDLSAQYGISNIVAMSVQGQRLFIKADGSLWGTGDNSIGQLGLGDSNAYPSVVTLIVSNNVKTVATGGFFTMFIKTDGSLWVMGRNTNGELGDDSSDNDLFHVTVPEQIVPSGVVGIAPGQWHSAFIKSDGSLWTMGYNADGQLGDGTADFGNLSYHNVPHKVVSSGVVKAVAAQNATVFLKADGSLWVMGENDDGQLIIDDSYVDVPTKVVDSNVVDVAIGQYHMLFVKSDGSLWAVGGNDRGQLGTGIQVNYTNVPQKIVSNGVVAVSAERGLHGLFLKTDGSLWGMGDNGGGELGLDPTNQFVYTPTLLVTGVVATLPAIGSFSYSAGGSPVRSSNPWQFSATYSALQSGLKLRVQSTLNTNSAASWANLPGNPFMTHLDANWTLNTTDVPTGTRYFRVVASAPGYFDHASTVVGPDTVQAGIGPFGDFTWDTLVPSEAGKPWQFQIVQPTVIAGLALRLQSTTMPTNLNSWTDLSGGAQMTRSNSVWSLNTTNVPVGSRSFRVVASASNYLDRVSDTLAFNVAPSRPVSSHTNSSSGSYSLQSLPETSNPVDVFIQAVGTAAAQYNIFDQSAYTAAITLAAQQFAQAELRIAAEQNVSITAMNIGPNASIELKGHLTGALSLANFASIVGQGGGNIVGQGGGNMTHDAGTAALISQDANALTGQDGNALIGQDGNALIGQDGNALIGQDGNAFVQPAMRKPLSPVKHLPHKDNGPVQPSFTGISDLTGNFTAAAGTTLMVGIAGTNTTADGAQQYDQLLISGDAKLNGATIAFGLFNADDQSNRVDVFQPKAGSTYDVLVASNVVAQSVQIRGPIWGDGLFFKGYVVTRDDGWQALRLEAVETPPQIFVTCTNTLIHLAYATNYTGYRLEGTTSFSSTNWATISSNNAVEVSITNAAKFFRLTKP